MLALRGRLAVPRTRLALSRPLALRSPTHVSRPLPSRLLSTPASSPPEPVYAKPSRWRSFLQILGRVTLVTIVTAAGTFYYVSQKDRSPGSQLPHDPEKKTIVVLGSGWGATSLLKSLDTADYNVILVSPKNYFLFTPLLPSVAVGTLSPKSILQPTRYITRHKKRAVSVIEAEAQQIDPTNKTVAFSDTSEVTGQVTSTKIRYDYLVYAVGAETQTFNIPGVKEHACFMKELHDAEQMNRRFMDCLESAAFPDQSQEEIDRLLHIVVVGGGPTGIELSGEVHDFLEDDLKAWYPELAGKIKISLVEALPSVLPMFSKQLIEYTESTFKESKIDILTKTMVQQVKEDSVVLKMPDGSIKEVPCGLVVWAAGNKGRAVTQDLMAKFPKDQTVRRGISVDDHLRMKGSDGSIFAIGDCTATSYAPTAQVAAQQGAYLARLFAQIARKEQLEKSAAVLAYAIKDLENDSAALIAKKKQMEHDAGKGSDGAVEFEKEETKVREGKLKLEKEQDRLMRLAEKVTLRPFHYSHQGSLAYIGSERAIADLPFMNGNFASGGMATYLFWRSAYLSTLFSLRNRTLVATDWLKVKLFGRDVSRD